MSQKTPRRLQGARGVISYYLRFQDTRTSGHRCQKPLAQNSISRDQQNTILKRNILKETFNNSLPAAVNGPLSDGELTCLSHAENGGSYQSLANTLAIQRVPAECCCAGDISLNGLGSTVQSYLEKTIAHPGSLICEVHQRKNLDVKEVCRMNENGRYPCEKGDSSPSCQQEPIAGSATKFAPGNCASASTQSDRSQDRTSNELKKITDCHRKACGSSSFHKISEYQRVHRKDPHPKQLSKKLGMSSLKLFPDNAGSAPNLQTDLQKSRSSVSVSHCCSPVIECHMTSDLNIVTPDGASSCESTQDITSRNRLTHSVDKRHTFRASHDGQSGSLRCQSLCQLNASSNYTSSTARRFQEPHLRETARDQAKLTRNRVQLLQQKFTPEQRQEHRTQIFKSYVPNEKKLQKLEKPYRQWHRISRVVAAETKFIISPFSSGHLWYKCTDNKTSPEQKLESPVKNSKTNVKEETPCPGLQDDPELTAANSSPGWADYRNLCNDQEVSTRNPMSEYHTLETETSLVEPEGDDVDVDVHDTDGTISVSSITLCAMPLDDGNPEEAPVDGRESSSTLTDHKCNNAEPPDTPTTCEVEKSDEVIGSSASELSLSKSPSQLPRHKLASLKHPHLANPQHRKKTGHELKDGADCNTILGETIVKVKPPGQVSKASQVSGPLITGIKREASVEFSKAALSSVKVPILRTATRSRNRVASPKQVSGSTSNFPPCDISSAVGKNCSAFGPPSTRAVSRHGSRSSKHGSRSSSTVCGRAEKARGRQPAFHHKGAASGDGISGTCKDGFKRVNVKKNSGDEVNADAGKESHLRQSKSSKVFLVGVASKLLQKVNRAGLHVHWSEPDKKYIDVQATTDYKGSLPGQLSFNKGQRIKQRSFIEGSSDNMSYGYYRVGRLRKKKKGLFPSNTVSPENESRPKDTQTEAS